MRARILAIAVLAVTVGGAHGHERWANGEPVPAWAKRACCGPTDVHHLRPEQVHQQQDGFHVDGLSEVVPYAKALPSPDGEYWGFWHTYSDGSTSSPYCFFAGAQGS